MIECYFDSNLFLKLFKIIMSFLSKQFVINIKNKYNKKKEIPRRIILSKLRGTISFIKTNKIVGIKEIKKIFIIFLLIGIKLNN